MRDKTPPFLGGLWEALEELLKRAQRLFLWQARWQFCRETTYMMEWFFLVGLNRVMVFFVFCCCVFFSDDQKSWWGICFVRAIVTERLYLVVPNLSKSIYINHIYSMVKKNIMSSGKKMSCLLEEPPPGFKESYIHGVAENRGNGKVRVALRDCYLQWRSPRLVGFAPQPLYHLERPWKEGRGLFCVCLGPRFV